MSLKRYIVLRVEFPTTSDRQATKLGDQLVEFGSALGATFIVDEGLAYLVKNKAFSIVAALERQRRTYDAPDLIRLWDEQHDQDALCRCRHPYYRHFDTYDDMRPVGCKYCPCFRFEGAP